MKTRCFKYAVFEDKSKIAYFRLLTLLCEGSFSTYSKLERRGDLIVLLPQTRWLLSWDRLFQNHSTENLISRNFCFVCLCQKSQFFGPLLDVQRFTLYLYYPYTGWPCGGGGGLIGVLLKVGISLPQKWFKGLISGLMRKT